MLYQQGDLLITKVDCIKGKKMNHLVLAEGEVTGHKHQVKVITKEPPAELYEHEGTLFLRVLSDECQVVHEEHKTISLPKGNYQIGIVREFCHFTEAVRNVKD
jgi:hypothetical protein